MKGNTYKPSGKPFGGVTVAAAGGLEYQREVKEGHTNIVGNSVWLLPQPRLAMEAGATSS